ncbi:hypothetical protein L1987_47554 [Smallanthus sonchifolius]|uniref:Uncharacterized protein n=1 Tax=Smallanthus sonchifolius TaxID=185202 RepID=A0ACB9G2R5_9ASTR|nr:hypothetical protein L1987_47554 [Smallanthus sonchifolius]
MALLLCSDDNVTLWGKIPRIVKRKEGFKGMLLVGVACGECGNTAHRRGNSGDVYERGMSLPKEATSKVKESMSLSQMVTKGASSLLPGSDGNTVSLTCHSRSGWNHQLLQLYLPSCILVASCVPLVICSLLIFLGCFQWLTCPRKVLHLGPINWSRSRSAYTRIPYALLSVQTVRDVDMKHDFAFVEFSDPRDADDARYSLNGRDLNGSRLLLEFAKSTPREPGGSRVYVGRGPSPGSEVLGATQGHLFGQALPVAAKTGAQVTAEAAATDAKDPMNTLDKRQQRIMVSQVYASFFGGS